MHLGVAAQSEGANLVRLERIEGEGADKGHVHTQGAVLPCALYAQQGAIRDGDPGRVFQQRLAPGRVRLRLGGQGRAMASKVRRQAAMRGIMGAWLLLPRVLLWGMSRLTRAAWAHSKHLSLPGSSIISTISPGPRLRPTCAPSLTASTLLEASKKSPRPSPCLSPPDFGTGALPLTHLVGGAGCESLASTVSRACEAGRQLTRGLFLIPGVHQCNPTPWVYRCTLSHHP